MTEITEQDRAHHAAAMARYKDVRARVRGFVPQRPVAPAVRKPPAPMPASVQRPSSRVVYDFPAGPFLIPADAAPSSNPNKPRKCPREIMTQVAADFGINTIAMRSGCRVARTMLARHVAIYRVHHECEWMSLPMIGRLFDRDHSTVLSAIRRIQSLIDKGEITDPLSASPCQSGGAAK